MALIKCPKCGCLNALTYSRCSNCNFDLDSANDPPPPQQETAQAPPKPKPTPIPAPTPTAKERLKNTSRKLQETSDEIGRISDGIKKIGVGCGSLIWLFILFVVIGSCSSSIKNKASSSSSSESLKAEIENSKQPEEPEEKPIDPQPPEQEEPIESQVEPSEEFTPMPTDPLDGFTASQRNAIRQAKSYLDYSSFSRIGLIEQLSSEYGSRFSAEDATFAIEYLEDKNEVDWNEQAIKQAESYIESSPFSRQGLIDQLSSEYGSQFTLEESENAVIYLEDNNLVDWYEQAVKQAESYLENSVFSKQELIDQLSSEYGSQFTIDEAEYGADIAYR